MGSEIFTDIKEKLTIDEANKWRINSFSICFCNEYIYTYLKPLLFCLLFCLREALGTGMWESLRHEIEKITTSNQN